MTSLKERFGERVEELRRLHGMKREAFGEAIGMSTTSAGEIEKGRSFPRPENLEKIARVLNVPLKELFDYSDKRYFPAPRMKAVEVRRVAAKARPASKP